MNGKNDLFSINFRKSEIVAKAVINEITNAINNFAVPISDTANNSPALRSPAPAIIGADIKKEKLVACLRDNPRPMPVAIVIPDREIPGTNAVTCAKPIIHASENPARSIFLRLFDFVDKSANKRATAVINRPEATTVGDLKNPSIQSLAK